MNQQIETTKKSPSQLSFPIGLDYTNLYNTFDEKFVQYQDVLSSLILAFETNENIVLYGKGGHNKSGFATTFFEQLNIKPFIKVLGQGSTIEDIFGGLDMKEFNNSGKIEFLLDNSFLNSEYVILEEAFDAPLNVLEQLKDVLIRGEFRNGNQQFAMKTKMIICCTNRTSKDLRHDDSLAALLERFHLWWKVDWPSYNASMYSKMFKKVIGSNMNDFAALVETACQYKFISPRTAVKACKIYMNSGVESLKYIDDFTENAMDDIRNKSSDIEKIKLLREIQDTITELYDPVNLTENFTPLEQMMICKKIIRDINNLINNGEHFVDDLFYDEMQTIIKATNVHKREAERKLDNHMMPEEIENMLEEGYDNIRENLKIYGKKYG